MIDRTKSLTAARFPAPGRCLRGALLATAALTCIQAGTASAQTTATLNGTVFTNQGLQGVGRLSADLRDKFGETFGSMSALQIDLGSWRRTASGGYSGTFFALPDRGYNVVGTTNYMDRYNIIDFNFNPYTGTANLPAGAAQQNQLQLTLRDTVLFTEQNGTPFSGLDPAGATTSAPTYRAAANGFPDLPVAPNGRIAMDPEGFVRAPDGTLYISDEYGPYIYHFTADGKLISAVRPPDALIPIRSGVENFSSNAAPAGTPAPIPGDPVTGRQNNQGLEGLTISADGTKLYTLLQSATRQDGGTGGSSVTRDNTRMLVYGIGTNANNPPLLAEYVVTLPKYNATGAGAPNRVAADSELLALNNTQFLVLARDSGNGLGLAATPSIYRQIDLIDITNATNIAGTAYDGTTPVAPGGKLAASVTAVAYSSFVNINDAAQLAKFGLTNGGNVRTSSLSEKWEALGLAPALDPTHVDDFFLLVGNDNDFLTTNGFQVGAAYDAGANADTTILAYRLTLPTYVDPLAVASQKATAGLLGEALSQSALSVQQAAAADQTNRTQSIRSGLSAIRAAGTGDFAIGGDYWRLEPDAKVTRRGTPRVWAAGAGADYAIADGLAIGIGAGYGDLDSSFSALGKSSGEVWAVGPYVSWTSADGLYLDVSYRYIDLDLGHIERNTGAYGLTATGKTKGDGHNVAVEIGQVFTSGNFRFGPVGGLSYDRVSLDAWNEDNAVHLNLDHPSQTVEQTALRVGGFVSTSFDLGGVVVVPELQLNYRWDVGNRDGRAYSTVLSTRRGNSLATQTAVLTDPSGSGFDIGAGIAFNLGAATLLINGQALLAEDDSTGWNVGTAVRFAF